MPVTSGSYHLDETGSGTELGTDPGAGRELLLISTNSAGVAQVTVTDN